MAVVASTAKNANASKAVSSLVYHLVGKRSSEKMCIRRLRNSAGGKRRGFLPHNTKSMIGIVAHLLGYSFGRRASLCLLFYLLCFLYLLSILYDGFAGRGLDTLPLSMNIVDLRQTTVRQIEPLLEEEARLMPLSGPVDPPLLDQGFHLYTRQFMLLDLQKVHEAKSGASAGMRLNRWNDRYFEPCAKLIYLAYANHVDGEINDQYRSRSGALKFLKNIILLPGCGQFVPAASFVLHEPGSEELVAAVLTSEVSPGVGHTTQICVLPGYQGHGLGRMLMQTSAEALHSMKFRELTLTVTSDNRAAVQLYENLGFHTIKSFTAGVWPR